MQKLNFPDYKFRLKNTENKISIFDIVRKKFVILTPEEWVRQHIVRFLIEVKQYPIHLIAVEKQLKINDLTKRFDVLVFDAEANPLVLVECKAPQIAINQLVFDQIARYNLTIKAKYIMVTNGLEHYYSIMDNVLEKYNFLEELPVFNRK